MRCSVKSSSSKRKRDVKVKVEFGWYDDARHVVGPRGVEAALEAGIGGAADRERIRAEQLVGLPEQDVDEAAAIELRGVLDADVGAAAALDAVPAGELVDLEQIASRRRSGSARPRSGTLPMPVFVRARTISCAIGSMVWVPQDCTLMNG